MQERKRNGGPPLVSVPTLERAKRRTQHKRASQRPMGGHRLLVRRMVRGKERRGTREMDTKPEKWSTPLLGSWKPQKD